MKKFGYFAAISLTCIAQAAWAQAIVVPPQVDGLAVVNQPVTLKAVTLSSSMAANSVTLSTGVLWKFAGSGTITTVAGVKVAPAGLKVGMSCILNGERVTNTYNVISTLACK